MIDNKLKRERISRRFGSGSRRKIGLCFLTGALTAMGLALLAPNGFATPVGAAIPSVESHEAVAELLGEAAAHIERREFDFASSLLERALRIDASDAQIWQLFGRLRALQGENEQARAMIQKSQSLTPISSTLRIENQHLLTRYIAPGSIAKPQPAPATVSTPGAPMTTGTGRPLLSTGGSEQRVLRASQGSKQRLAAALIDWNRFHGSADSLRNGRQARISTIEALAVRLRDVAEHRRLRYYRPTSFTAQTLDGLLP